MTRPTASRRSTSLPSATAGSEKKSDRTVNWVLRIAVAACLVIDAVVHLRLASSYGQATAPGHISEGLLFQLEAAAALVIAVLVLVLGSRLAFAAAFVVAASAFVAVVLFTYVNVPALGPIPSMYEPIWSTEKAISAVAEALGAALAAFGFIRAHRLGRQGSQPSHPGVESTTA